MPIPSFGFWIADAIVVDGEHVLDESSAVLLSPGPSAVEYPDVGLGAVIDTADGRVVLQIPSKDNRHRAWIFNGMRAWMQKYQTLMPILERTRSRYRLQGGRSPYVYLCDAETGELDKQIEWDTDIDGVVRTKGWVRCRVFRVSKKVRNAGDVVYDEIRMSFVIDDPEHNVFE